MLHNSFMSCTTAATCSHAHASMPMSQQLANSTVRYERCSQSHAHTRPASHILHSKFSTAAFPSSMCLVGTTLSQLNAAAAARSSSSHSSKVLLRGELEGGEVAVCLVLHHVRPLVLAHAALKEVGLPLQADHLHPVKRVAHAPALLIAAGACRAARG